MPLYEIVLRFRDRDEVRLTDRDGYEPGAKMVIAQRTYVVARLEADGRPPWEAKAIVMASPLEKAARSQAVFREVNENISKLTGRAAEPGYSPFICECSDVECVEPLQITAAEYEAVRADGTHFAIASGHQQPGIERVVEGNGRFLVVQKLGRAAEIADAHDPRRSRAPRRSQRRRT